MKTRNLVERAFGVLKNQFQALKTRLRVKKPETAAKLIVCAGVLHNLCIIYGEEGDDLAGEEVDPPHLAAAVHDAALAGLVFREEERRRLELLQSFLLSLQRQPICHCQDWLIA
jgi:hypothetical protein